MLDEVLCLVGKLLEFLDQWNLFFETTIEKSSHLFKHLMAMLSELETC